MPWLCGGRNSNDAAAPPPAAAYLELAGLPQLAGLPCADARSENNEEADEAGAVVAGWNEHCVVVAERFVVAVGHKGVLSDSAPLLFCS
mmetsp:Transcript_107253/g.280083  ORF Transcript_107253/g.280083 Transcript_107253/m.280083 type:complete len:89 (-) Transcript_107253:638-904(-)